MSLFPIIQPRAAAARETEMPLYREADWDFEHDIPIWSGGAPVIVTGAKAVLVWAWKALSTPRFRYEIYSHAYGCECEELIGQTYSEELKRAEAVRFVRECLEINPYIVEADEISVTFLDEKLQIACRLVTVYGEVSISV